MKKKGLISVLCLMLVVLTCAFSLAGCGNGKFWTLQEAYDKELLTVEDLESIAGYLNTQTNCEPPLRVEQTLKIKEDYAEMRRNLIGSKSKMTSEDSIIHAYFGTYGDCIALFIDSTDDIYFAVDVDEWVKIGGVDFHYVIYYEITIYEK